MEEFNVYATQEDLADVEHRQNLFMRRTEPRLSALEEGFSQRGIAGILLFLAVISLSVGNIFFTSRINRLEDQIAELEVQKETVVVKMPTYGDEEDDALCCPVCGWAGQYYPGDDGWYIECLNPDCKCHTHISTDKDSALVAWNDGEVYDDVF